MKRLILIISSNFGLGYAPVASGTFGTLLGIPVFYLVDKLPIMYELAFVLVLTIFACWISGLAGKIYGVVDDGRIVIDELAGYMFTVLLLPFNWFTAIAAFFIFRLFDIVKPPPASWFDTKMKNGTGVVLDDVAAGIYAALVLRIVLFYSPF